MVDKNTEKLLRHLIHLCERISQERCGNPGELFELTKTAAYPQIITELAESFGMMMVKVDAREYRLEQIVEELKKAQSDLAAAKERLAHENIALKLNLRQKFSPTNILGKSQQIRNILSTVGKIADTPINVLITGETGTGKELIAKAIHYNSSRSNKPFVVLNCSAIPETIFESEIFGIEKGVATGVEKRMGKIEQANYGTLFLDEIADMPLTSQAKILRVIEDHEIEWVGGRKTVPVDIRIIAATNKELKEEVENDNFREDLFYRLNVINIHVPPLRDRKDDIPILFNFFLDEYSRKFGKDKIQASRDVIEFLKQYSWPGNVRELENEAERLVALAYNDTITVDDFSENLREPAIRSVLEQKNLSIKKAEELLIKNALKEAGGNKTKAARTLGLSREGLRKKLKKYGLDS
ncbi:MAG: sigma-54 dependent transcriptional regulator [Proteobacteria bacterium]|nr:sigma-54 dependent transcriptional regulator [Pseudomonadota bacterium]